MSAPVTKKHIPKDAQVVMDMLKELKIDEFDSRVINQVLEYVFWNVTVKLDDARVYAIHAKKKIIDSDDVKLAVQMQCEQHQPRGPTRDILLELARSKNNVALPVLKSHTGIRLPPDRYCLTQPNYKLKGHVFSGAKRSAADSFYDGPGMNGMKQTPKTGPTFARTTSSSNFSNKSDSMTSVANDNGGLLPMSLDDTSGASAGMGSMISQNSLFDSLSSIKLEKEFEMEISNLQDVDSMLQ